MKTFKYVLEHNYAQIARNKNSIVKLNSASCHYCRACYQFFLNAYY